jgi:pSer/pThr/pTyr-binding forkhead associated (FHA) protein
MPLRFRILAAPPSPSPGPPREPSASEERTLELDEAIEEIRFGRRAGLEIELPFPALAPLHARMVKRGGGWELEDLAGGDATWLDEARLGRGVAVAVLAGATIRLAHVQIRFDGVAPPARAAEGTATLARRLVSDLFRSGGQGEAPRLIAPSAFGPGAAGGPPALRLARPDHPYRVGRGGGCDLVLDHDDVSREHLQVVRRWGGVHVLDLGSKNGVSIAGQPIEGERRLRDGDRLELGSVELRLDDPEDRYLRQLEDAPVSSPAALADRARQPSAPLGPGAARRPRALGLRATVAVAVAVLLAIAGIAVALLVSG